MLRLAIDTNILVYAEGFGDADRCLRANALMQRLVDAPVVLPVQVLGETFRVLQGKYRLPAAAALALITRWSDVHDVADSTWLAMQEALDLAADHGLSIWDALIFSVAAAERCRVLLSEDLQHGFSARGVTVLNPFAEPAHPLLAALTG